MMSKQQFTQQLFELKNQYRQDNDWVNTWAKWNDEAVMINFIECAYKLYAATATNALNLTMLGGTEIRTDDTVDKRGVLNGYVRNFGVTAASGIQDEKTIICVREELKRRGLWAMNPDPTSRNPDRSPAPVTGTGSILSEKSWTPILNDSLILGAITAGQDFALGFELGEQTDWNAMNGAKANRTAVLASKFDTSALINAWKSFLNSQKRMFFFGDIPRVFTRELLGLHFFGYKPEFHWHQLGFHAGAGKRVHPDFRTYLQKLRDVGFQKPANQVNIMKTISMYLFNDPTAIGSPWPPTTKT